MDECGEDKIMIDSLGELCDEYPAIAGTSWAEKKKRAFEYAINML